MGRSKRQSNRKLEIVFDAKDRKDFLTGFQKRKKERKKRASENLEKLLKEEQKRMRLQVKDVVKNFKKSYEPLPDVDQLLKEDEYENEAVTVKVIELSVSSLDVKQTFLGENKPQYSCNEDEIEEELILPTEDVPGMSLVGKSKLPLRQMKKGASSENTISSKKDLNRLTRRKMTQSIKNNKLFKMKTKLDRFANKNKSRKEKMMQLKQAKKQTRGKFQREFKKRN